MRGVFRCQDFILFYLLVISFPSLKVITCSFRVLIWQLRIPAFQDNLIFNLAAVKVLENNGKSLWHYHCIFCFRHLAVFKTFQHCNSLYLHHLFGSYGFVQRDRCFITVTVFLPYHRSCSIQCIINGGAFLL